MTDTASLVDRVVAALREDLMSGKLPPTERLAESSLAERYDVSRTPVREALARLLADGLVERRDRGLYPYRPGLDDLDGFYELRTTVELRGILRVEQDDARAHDHDILGPELDRWHHFRRSVPRPDAAFVSEDEQFHIALLSSAGNRALVAALQLVNSRIRRVGMFDYLTVDRMQATIDEHIVVAEHVMQADLPAAREALLAHIEASRTVAIRRASEALSMAGIVMALRP